MFTAITHICPLFHLSVKDYWWTQWSI